MNYPVHKDPNIELQLDKILCLTLRHYPSGLKNYNKRQNQFKIGKRNVAAYTMLNDYAAEKSKSML